MAQWILVAGLSSSPRGLSTGCLSVHMTGLLASPNARIQETKMEAAMPFMIYSGKSHITSAVFHLSQS